MSVFVLISEFQRVSAHWVRLLNQQCVFYSTYVMQVMHVGYTCRQLFQRIP